MSLDSSRISVNNTPDKPVEGISSSKQRPAKGQPDLSQPKSIRNGFSSPYTRLVFAMFFASNILAALYAPIQDCDEVFNYWEPTHYLNHRYGLQTWEYAPEFSIRSWLYIVIHAIVGKFGSLLSSNKAFEFYFVRVILAMVCYFIYSKP
jgi:alpha-1,2-mannosyltransferase